MMRAPRNFTRIVLLNNLRKTIAGVIVHHDATRFEILRLRMISPRRASGNIKPSAHTLGLRWLSSATAEISDR
ncbi:MAG: hypothetical protein AUG75_15070 [Cyanobacteria bacterium 13_1_20CM_4_61_6]|nr:MAG: hypothetical protein AUG75_15070 [Cyanobacteria bacterium 13_1_20CM_4_61_6]